MLSRGGAGNGVPRTVPGRRRLRRREGEVEGGEQGDHQPVVARIRGGGLRRRGGDNGEEGVGR